MKKVFLYGADKKTFEIMKNKLVCTPIDIDGFEGKLLVRGQDLLDFLDKYFIPRRLPKKLK